MVWGGGSNRHAHPEPLKRKVEGTARPPSTTHGGQHQLTADAGASWWWRAGVTPRHAAYSHAPRATIPQGSVSKDHKK